MDAEGEGKLHLLIAVSLCRNFTTETVLSIFSSHSPLRDFFFHFFIGSSPSVIVALVTCVTNFIA